MTPRCGLVLLTGGRGARLGGPKHDRPHPSGGSWGGYLVSVFQTIVPEGPVQILGEALPDLPLLARLDDPRQGPAVALRTWAASSPPPARRWWVLACDQIRWTPEAFEAWLVETERADPEGRVWALTIREGHCQPLGGFIGATRLPDLAGLEARSIHGLLDALPTVDLPGASWSGGDIDTPEDLAGFTPRRAHPARL